MADSATKCPVYLAVEKKSPLSVKPEEGVLPKDDLHDEYIDTWIAHHGSNAVSGSTASDKNFQHLFYFSRNSNYNVVVFEANCNEEGEIKDPKNAVVNYWFDIDPKYIKKASKAVLDKHSRVELGYIDKTMAYGASSKLDTSTNEIALTLVAMKKKRVVLVKVDGKWRAKMQINGKDCIVLKIYVSSKMGWTGPKVNYVSIWGRCVETGNVEKEVVTP